VINVLALATVGLKRGPGAVWVTIPGYVAHFIICALKKGHRVKKYSPRVSVTRGIVALRAAAWLRAVHDTKSLLTPGKKFKS
jgi:hypothetical protein